MFNTFKTLVMSCIVEIPRHKKTKLLSLRKLTWTQDWIQHTQVSAKWSADNTTHGMELHRRAKPLGFSKF